jgi:hypothetical protein
MTSVARHGAWIRSVVRVIFCLISFSFNVVTPLPNHAVKQRLRAKNWMTATSRHVNAGAQGIYSCEHAVTNKFGVLIPSKYYLF